MPAASFARQVARRALGRAPMAAGGRAGHSYSLRRCPVQRPHNAVFNDSAGSRAGMRQQCANHVRTGGGPEGAHKVMSHALIVDDDVDAAAMMAALIAGEKFTVASANTLAEARRQIVLNPPDIVLLDLQLPDGNGMELFADTELISRSEIVLITGHASLETSIQALRLGAADYLVKPVHLKQLQGVLSRVTPPATLRAEVDTMAAQLAKKGHFGGLWGRSAPMMRVYQQISRVAGTGVTVLVTGESGTGKEVVAQTVHDLSRRRKRPFLAVNCGAVSPNLIESEIFGHEKGSFTGADRQHQGFFERAHGGTLFLDEITEMPLDLQVKLLRVLETGTYQRVGSTTTQEADVRVIAATNRDPGQAVASGKLREDLLYRLNVFPIELPPLRERIEDVPLLAEHFLALVGEREGSPKRFTEQALSKLQAYRWPGNVRELRNVVQRAYVMAEGDRISDEWLPSDGSRRPEQPPAAVLPLSAAPPSVHAPPAPAYAAPPRPAEPLVPSITLAVGTSLAEAERALILATLQHCNHHKERTAAALGVSLKTLYNRLKEYSADELQEPVEAAGGARKSR
jgi:two-component system response regulator AtoC